MGRLKQHWIGLAGFLLLAVDFCRLLWEWQWTRRLLEMANVGQAVDFVLQHWDEPGWVGAVMSSPVAQLLIMIAGLGLIYWDSKRLNKSPFKLATPRQMIFGGFLIIVIGAVI